MLQLTRPLAIIDLETTGVNLGTDRIVEIAIVKIMPDGKKLVKRLQERSRVQAVAPSARATA